jgi:hypothetical protein
MLLRVPLCSVANPKQTVAQISDSPRVNPFLREDVEELSALCRHRVASNLMPVAVSLS